MAAPSKTPTKQKKAETIRLTKAQKLRVGQIIRLENRISVCRDYTQLWSQFFQCFADDLTQRQITPEEEKAFFQTITQLARQHFLFVELMGDTFDKGGDILSVLSASVSLSTIKSMDEGTLSKLELDWHTIYLDMYVALGRLLRQMPGGMKISDKIAAAEAQVKAAKDAAEGKAVPGARKGFLGRFRRAGA